MNRYITLVLLVAVLLQPGTHLFAQSAGALAIGDTVKGAAWEMVKIPGKKLYILDFWSTSCTSCIQAFPKMVQLKKDFEQDLEVYLVNSYETEVQVNARMQQLNERRTKIGSPPILVPSLPRLSGDTVLKQLFPHVAVPHHVWLDGTGKVLYITSGENATAAHVKKALAGEALSLSFKRDLKAEGYDAWKQGLLQVGHDALQPAFYSGFIKGHSGLGGGNAQSTDSVKGVFRRSWINADVLSLYRSTSYELPSRPRLLVTLKDKERFKRPEQVNGQEEWQRTYVVSYEMVLPIEDKVEVGAILLADLNRFCDRRFGIEGVMEKRVVPAFVLVVRQPQKIKTAGGKREAERSDHKITWTNTPLSSIGNTLRAQLEDVEGGLIFISDVEGNKTTMADMELTIDRNNIKGLKDQLRRYGLDLLQEKRTVDVLVVRDKVRKL
jgi:thiol-disulfide isomerase/thioredoxin